MHTEKTRKKSRERKTQGKTPVYGNFRSQGHSFYFDTGRLETRYPGPGNLPRQELLFVFREHEILAPAGAGPVSFIPVPGSTVPPHESCIYIGTLGTQPCYALAVSPMETPPEGFLFYDLRDLSGRVEDEVLGVAGRASQVLAFDRNAKFCGRCGSRTKPKKTELARECPLCGNVVYPRLSPAVIVLVYCDDEVLLARSPRFPPGIFSVIAGFVEPGETLEHALHREVMEETGITVRDPVYFGSQPWPFPDSLMVGFTAAYAGGSIRPDHEEIEDAGWFRYDGLPSLPGRLSISRALIEWFVRDRTDREKNRS